MADVFERYGIEQAACQNKDFGPGGTACRSIGQALPKGSDADGLPFRNADCALQQYT
jgi:hypothetical protein